MVSPTESARQAERSEALARAIITRQQALAAGARFYFTGNACPKGHICERYTDGGNRGKCVLCFKERNKRYLKNYGPRYYEANKEKFKEWSHASYLRHRDEHAARGRAWRRTNRQKTISYLTKWRESNRDLYRKIQREWGRKNKHKRAAQRGMRRKAEGTFTDGDIAEIMKLQKRRCAMPTCRTSLKKAYQIDHIEPLNRGGSNWRQNIQLLCPACNARKKDHDPIDHARSLGLLI